MTCCVLSSSSRPRSQRFSLKDMQRHNGSATHRVLFLGELLLVIIEKLAENPVDSRTLAAFSSTCQFVYRLATPVLWRSLGSLKPLLHSVLRDAVAPSDEPGCLSLSRPLTKAEHDNMHFFGCLVKVLKIQGDVPGFGGLDQRTAEILLFTSQGYLVQNVEVIDIGSFSMIQAAYRLVGFKTRVVHISLPTSLEHVWNGILDIAEYLAVLAESTLLTCSKLQSFIIDGSNIRRTHYSLLEYGTSEYSKFLRSAPSSLRRIGAPIAVTTDGASAMLRRPLDSCHLNLEIAKIPILIDVLSSLPGRKRCPMPWVQLKTLRLDFDKLTDDVLKFLSKLAIPNIEELHITTCYRTGATWNRVSALCQVIAQLCNDATLTSLKVHLSRMRNEFQVEEQLEPEHELYLDDLKPLLGFKGLTTFELASPDLAVGNTIVAAIATAFPQLRVLDLNGMKTVSYTPKATLKALVILNDLCPNLVNLGITVDTTRHVWELIRGVPNPNLRTLLLGASIFDRPTTGNTPKLQLLGWAMYRMMPNVKTITVDYDTLTRSERPESLARAPQCIKWSSWQDGFDYVHWAFRQPIQLTARSGCRARRKLRRSPSAPSGTLLSYLA